MTFSLDGSPYTIDATGQHVLEESTKLQERADLLRERGSLTDATLRAYFGDKRYEQIAESNAIEGSTLSVGETELAVEKGITITGHDPAYSADATNLSRALAHMVELAKDTAAVGLSRDEGTPQPDSWRGADRWPVQLESRTHLWIASHPSRHLAPGHVEHGGLGAQVG